MSVSIHAARVGRDHLYQGGAQHQGVSIHAARVGRDVIHWRASADRVVSIHAARVGRDGAYPAYYPAIWRFNPRGPCGPRRGSAPAVRPLVVVSIHAARVGRDATSDKCLRCIGLRCSICGLV